MQKIYMLEHEYITGKKGEYKETKLIGFFSNIKAAKLVISKYKTMEGFCDFHTRCFRISKYCLRGSQKINFVYFLEHGYDTDVDNEYTVSTNIGAYRDEAEAIQCMERLSKEFPFKQFPLDCFYIGCYKLGKCHWEEGFFDYNEEE